MLNIQSDLSQRIVFRDAILKLFEETDIKVFTSDTLDILSSKFSLAGGTAIKNVGRLKAELLSLDFKVNDIETTRCKGLLIEESTDNFGIIIAPKDELASLKQSIFNQSGDSQLLFDIQQYGRENNLFALENLDFQLSKELVRQMDLVLAESLGILYAQLCAIKYENSHKEYKRLFVEYRNNERTFSFNHGGYNNNFQLFCWVYHWEIKILADILGEQCISIHDVGTNVAQFPLLLVALKQQDLYGLNIGKVIASDIGWTGEPFAKLIIRKNPEYKSIDFMKINVVTETDSMPFTDVIIANDVLEHLSNDELAMVALEALWNKTKRVLIVHVPIEPEPNLSWDHHVVFSGDKLREWASKLDGAQLISDSYSDDYRLLTDQGYLIVAKRP